MFGTQKAVEKCFAKIEALEDKLEILENDNDYLEDRITELETRLDSMESDHTDYIEDLEEVRREVTRVEDLDHTIQDAFDRILYLENMGQP